MSGDQMPEGGNEPYRDRNSAEGFEGSLDGLLRRNREWTDLLSPGDFEGIRDSQSPGVVSVCCSDSRVSQEGMFRTSRDAGALFKPSNIGNKVITVVENERFVDGSFLYGLENLDTASGVVVGHTGCGAITAAYAIATGEDVASSPGVLQEIEIIVEIIEAALDSDAIDTDAEEGAIINQLVEYNVDAQIDFLCESEEVSDERDLYGFVYDFQNAYGEVDGRTVLVNANGETDVGALRESVPGGYEAFVGSLLD